MLTKIEMIFWMCYFLQKTTGGCILESTVIFKSLNKNKLTIVANSEIGGPAKKLKTDVPPISANVLSAVEEVKRKAQLTALPTYVF